MVQGAGLRVEGRRFNDLGFRSADLGFLKGLFSDLYKVEGFKNSEFGIRKAENRKRLKAQGFHLFNKNDNIPARLA
jgi:hypothetical protein